MGPTEGELDGTNEALNEGGIVGITEGVSVRKDEGLNEGLAKHFPLVPLLHFLFDFPLEGAPT